MFTSVSSFAWVMTWKTSSEALINSNLIFKIYLELLERERRGNSRRRAWWIWEFLLREALNNAERGDGAIGGGRAFIYPVGEEMKRARPSRSSGQCLGAFRHQVRDEKIFRSLLISRSRCLRLFVPGGATARPIITCTSPPPCLFFFLFRALQFLARMSRSLDLFWVLRPGLPPAVLHDLIFGVVLCRNSDFWVQITVSVVF